MFEHKIEKEALIWGGVISGLIGAALTALAVAKLAAIIGGASSNDVQ
jgi:hypothetical protein